MSTTETCAREQYPYHRRFVRHRVRVRVEVLNGGSFGTWTINLSQDGLCFEIPELVAVDARVAVAIYPSRERGIEPICGVCRVVWNERVAGGRNRHGGQFTAFDGDGGDRLKEWLKKI